MNVFQILILGLVQGAAELLPVSSSAHVIMAEKLLGLDPTLPEMTLLLVMLHTGTMFAVLVFYWKAWRTSFFRSGKEAWAFLRLLALATALTGVVGLGLKVLIEKVVLAGKPHAEIEMIFGNLTLISASLAVVGCLIVYSGLKTHRASGQGSDPGLLGAVCMGAVQGLCLPFRGFSRSGATISTGLLAGVDRARAEEFSFALAVIITPPAIARELWRVVRDHHQPGSGELWSHVLVPGLVGMVCAFVVGLFALRWLSQWLETGHWHWFGYYCLAAAAGVLVVKNLF